MHLFLYKYLQKIFIYFFITSYSLYAADRHHYNNSPDNNRIHIIIERPISFSAPAQPTSLILSITYYTQEIDRGRLYSKQNKIHLNNVLSLYQSITIEKMKDSAASCITFLSPNSQEKETAVTVCDYDTLLISDLTANPIIIKKKNSVTNIQSLVARFILQ